MRGGAPDGALVREGARAGWARAERRRRDYPVPPRLAGKLMVIFTEIEPGGGCGDEPYSQRSDEECVVLLKGKLDFWVGDELYKLTAGDSLTFESRIPHKNHNPGPARTEVWGIITPPSI